MFSETSAGKCSIAHLWGMLGGAAPPVQPWLSLGPRPAGDGWQEPALPRSELPGGSLAVSVVLPAGGGPEPTPAASW